MAKNRPSLSIVRDIVIFRSCSRFCDAAVWRTKGIKAVYREWRNSNSKEIRRGSGEVDVGFSAVAAVFWREHDHLGV